MFLIDDHPVVALGLRIILAEHPTLRLVGTASNLTAALRLFTTTLPDCLILDLVFEGSVMLSNVVRAREALPHGAIVIYSSLPMRLYAHDASAAGADAFLGKDADMSELATLIKRVVSQKLIDKIPITRSPERRDLVIIDGVHLTRREQQIAAEIGRGLSNDDIASQLALSPHTIAAHRENLRKKLDCRNSKQLVARLASKSLSFSDGI